MSKETHYYYTKQLLLVILRRMVELFILLEIMIKNLCSAYMKK